MNYSWGGAEGSSRPGKIFVGALPKSCTEQALGSFLSFYGQISNMNFKLGEDGLCKGFAFVTFADPQAAAAVVADSVNGVTVMDGKWIDCKEAVDGMSGKGAGMGGGMPPKGKSKGGGKPMGGGGMMMKGMEKGWGGGGGWNGGKDMGKGKGGFGKGWDMPAPWKGGGGMGKGGCGKGFGKDMSLAPAMAPKRQRLDEGGAWGFGGGKGWDMGKGGGKFGGKDMMGGGKGKHGGGGGKAPAPREDDHLKIFVGGLPRSATEETVLANFLEYGPVSKVEMKFDDAGTFRGFAFVTFEEETTKDLVLENFDNNHFDGKWIDCKPIGEKSDKGKGKGKGKW